MWAPATRCSSTSGLRAPSHSAAAGSAPLCRARRGQRHRHERHAEQGDQPHAEQARGHLAAGQPGQRGGQGQEGGSVGGAGVPPHRGDLVGERAAEPVRAVRVHVHVGVDHGALREVAVDVPAEQRRGEQQRGRPDGQYEQQGARGGRLGPADQAAEQHPGRDQQDDAEVHPDQAHRRPRRGGRQEVPDGQGAGRLTAEREDGGAGQAQHLAAAEIDGGMPWPTPGQRGNAEWPEGDTPFTCGRPARDRRVRDGDVCGAPQARAQHTDSPVRAHAQNTDSPVRVVKRSRAATPATELPRSSRPGLHTHSVHRPGTTAMMPPPTPLLPGRPTR